jgi:Secretion system C-terminal sorting domain/F5/8 type C domain
MRHAPLQLLAQQTLQMDEAIDGNKANFAGWASGTGVPQWLLLDFGSNKTFNRIILNTTTGYLLKDYDIQYWNGANYVTAAQVRNNSVKEVMTTFTTVTSSRVRIYCITGDQFNLARIDELEVYGSAPPIASASSTDVANGYSPAKAIDGNKANFAGWSSLTGVPQWLLLDYGTNRTFDKVVLNTTTGYLLKDYDIQSWNGSAYVTIAQVRNNTVKEVTTTFASVASSRVRIYCIAGDQFNLARIDELEVFNGNASARVANASKYAIETTSETVSEDGYYTWEKTGWINVSDATLKSEKSQGTIWHISKRGDVFVYHGTAEEVESKEINIYPNPSADEVLVSFYLNENAKTDIQIVDLQGKAISTSTNNGEKGLNQYRLELKGVKPGVYLLRVQNPEFSKTTRLVVER